MSIEFIVNPKVEKYCESQSTRPSQICDQIAVATVEKYGDWARMLTGPFAGGFLAFMVQLVKAKRVLEVGGFTGYSALAMAEALPANGECISLEIDIERANFAKDFWARSPHGKKCSVIVGDANASIQKLTGRFDLIFIDANKQGYQGYLKSALELLSDGGLIICDNCLWDGKVVEGEARDDETKVLREFNQFVASQSSLRVFLAPIRDGLYLIQKQS